MEKIMSDTHITFNQRKIKKNYRSITGHFPSIKNNRSVAFESKLESELFLMLEFDNSVISYLEQPIIEISINGKLKNYSADCYIKRVENSDKRDTIIEAKYTSDLKKHEKEFQEKFNSAKIATNEMNIDFEVFTEENCSKTQLSNLDFLYRYKLNPLHNKYEKIIIDKMSSLKKIKAKDLVISIGCSLHEYSLVSNTIWNLVANDKLKTDIYEEILTMNSFVEVI